MSLKVQDYLSEGTFKKFRATFATPGLCTPQQARRRIGFLSGFNPIRYDCCINSCVCFVGPAYIDLMACPHCHERRYSDDKSKKPRKVFVYIPIIPRLRSLVAHRKHAALMRYRAYDHPTAAQPNVTTDVFDAEHYQHLLRTRVMLDGRELNHKFFSDPRDIALGFATDGFSPFRGKQSRKHTAWPLLFFNYNLPPEVRFHKAYLLCAGIIPGPKKPWDMDSFLFPAIEELVSLILGVPAFDALERSTFMLRAYLILAFGDIPAISLLLRMKGHNALVPCRMCKILAVRNTESKTLYVPLRRNGLPGATSYDATRLPLRSHTQFLSEAHEVDSAPNEARSDALAKACGIKGTPLLSTLPSLTFPLSFPYGFMHLIWENLLPNLVSLWTNDFKGLSLSEEPFAILPSVWEAIGAACKASNRTIPSAFGANVPDIAAERGTFTAETWSLFAVHLGPILLRQRFRQERFYRHFTQLIGLINKCLQFEITHIEIDELEHGFREWVAEYERCVFIPNHT